MMMLRHMLDYYALRLLFFIRHLSMPRRHLRCRHYRRQSLVAIIAADALRHAIS